MNAALLTPQYITELMAYVSNNALFLAGGVLLFYSQDLFSRKVASSKQPSGICRLDDHVYLERSIHY